MKQVTVMFIMVIVALLPIWPYSQGWGYASSGGVFLLGSIIMALRALRAI